MSKDAKHNHDLMAVQTDPGALKAEELKQHMAQVVLSPSVQAADTIKEYLGVGPDQANLPGELATLAQAVNGGDLKRVEEVLIAQAHSLDVIFNTLAQRAINAEYIDALETFLRLGLKAQSQCVRTLEVLNTMKNPPHLAWVRQQNVAVNQQVNNNGAVLTDEASRAQEIENSANKLLEAQHEQRLDLETTTATSGTHPAMETVGEVHRPEDG